MKNEHENLIDGFVEDLDFDDMLKWLDLMEIDNEPPPIDDVYPDWERVKKEELMHGLCELFDLEISEILIAWKKFIESLSDDFEFPVESWHLFQKAKAITERKPQ